MEANISTQDRFYRRGLVLGYTLAEIMVLIIFALLLAISWLLAAKNEEIDMLSQSLDERGATMATLTERTRVLEELLARGDDFDDLFRELEQARELQNAQEQVNATLHEKLEALENESTVREEVIARLETLVANTLGELEQARELQNAQEQVNATLHEKLEALENESTVREEVIARLETLVANTLGELEQARELQNAQEQVNATLHEKLEALENESTVREEVIARLEQFENKIKAEMTAAGLDDSQVEEFVANTLGELADARRLADWHEGQVRNLQRKLEGLGKGTEVPACWASRETGKTEYIFNVALTSHGIITLDNALPRRSAEQAQLPLQTMEFEKEMRPEQFLVMAEPIFLWSKKEGCRFFVRVYDLTQDDEKSIYKQHLRTLGDRFYSYEDLNGTFRTIDGRN